ncbi:MAG: hypothetical protein MUF59_09955 [Candidatus Krumholzibacteria bacterium]|nr:hypothetical protein [Candidatus Krumholzibacteria bacterium]
MIELKKDSLCFTFPEVHPEAKLYIDFQRTLRIPDDGNNHFLPPGLGKFPLRHVDDFAGSAPPEWSRHGGVMLPMYQSEAMWLNFHSAFISEHGTNYPFAVRIAAGKIDALTGEEWTNGIHGVPQDYLVIPEQPWLDGFCVGKGIIRQFIAMPMGEGYTAEEQITGSAEHGGLQIIVYPMKRSAFERRFPKREVFMDREAPDACICPSMMSSEMGLAPGGKMRQEIYEDPFDFEDWNRKTFSRCFVHIANSLIWRAITGEQPPTMPPTAAEYSRAGMPWFDYYSEGSEAIEGSEILEKLKSVIRMGREKGESRGRGEGRIDPRHVIRIRKSSQIRRVREGKF